MPRKLLVLGAIAAASVCGAWVQATRAPVPRPVRAEISSERVGSAQNLASAAEASRPSPVRAAPAPQPASKSEPRVEVASSPANAIPRLGAGMRIVEDPAAAPEQSNRALTIEEMQNEARKESEGLVTVRNPDGSETLNHEGRFQDYFVIRVGPDGKPQYVCVQGEGALKRALPGAAASAKKEVK